MEKIIALAKRRGFVYPSSLIYGGLANSYDYGPLGAELLKNLRDIWWKYFVHKREDIVGVDTQILQRPEVWVASGHVSAFVDPVVEDKVTHKRYRADHLIEDWFEKNQGKKINAGILSIEEMAELIRKHNIKSPDNNDVTEPRKFNLLFETSIGVVEGDKNLVYLRGETAQGIFINFKNVLDSTRVRLPFGIAQIGKAFRNEVTTGQFVFRTLEFEQMEIEYFFDPANNWRQYYDELKNYYYNFITNIIGLSEEKLRWRQHSAEERSHYSKMTEDLEFKFSFGFKELLGYAYRTDYDLSAHIKHSGVDLSIIDPETKKKFVPHVIEPSIGLNRLFLAVLENSYFEDDQNERVVLQLPFVLAPYKLAVFPLLANKPDLVNTAKKVYHQLTDEYYCYWDDRGNIGKRYRYQDEIGTPYCITIDFQTLKDSTVTIRYRDSMKQVRVAIDKIKSFIKTENEKIF
ncbi:MAG: glycine--tRNA ligase [Patescibacteria group bacterium]|nr:MAG: glycine--tRNA ligase [Patescibacteria group bacterium]GIW64051.1 MAG: glycine--tRNA ligase [Patescibacteria group bacterium]